MMSCFEPSKETPARLTCSVLLIDTHVLGLLSLRGFTHTTPRLNKGAAKGVKLH